MILNKEKNKTTKEKKLPMLVKFQRQIVYPLTLNHIQIVSNLSHYAIYILMFYAQIACIWKNS